MKNIIFAFLCLFFISCHSSIDGEGPAIGLAEFESGDFSELIVDCNCDLTLIPSETPKIVVESHQNLIDNIQINSKRNKLNISENTRVKEYSLYNVNVYFKPGLTSIKLSGQAKMKVSGTLKSEKMNFELKDDSKIHDSFVDIQKMDFKLSGHGFVNLTGSSVDVTIHASDDSKIDISNLNAVNININSSDNSELQLYAIKSLSGTATDKSVVRYKGDPDKKTSLRDKASIEKIK